MSDHQQAAIEGALSALRGNGGSAIQLAQPTSSTVLLEEGDEAGTQLIAFCSARRKMNAEPTFLERREESRSVLCANWDGESWDSNC